MRHSQLTGKGILLALICALMAACSAQPEGSSANKQASTPTASPTESSKQASVGASKLDACTLLPQSKVEAALGGAVKSIEAGRSVEGSESTAAFSECAFKLDGAQTVSLFIRRSPVADNTPEAIGKVRDQLKEATGAESVAVSGLGDTAFWTSAKVLKQLHVFQGGNIYLYVTMMNFKDEAQAKEKAIELARQALANLPK